MIHQKIAVEIDGELSQIKIKYIILAIKSHKNKYHKHKQERQNLLVLFFLVEKIFELCHFGHGLRPLIKERLPNVGKIIFFLFKKCELCIFLPLPMSPKKITD